MAVKPKKADVTSETAPEPSAPEKPTARKKPRRARAAAPAVAAKTMPRHWHGVRDDDNVHWLSLDKYDSSTNTLSQDVLAALNAVLNELDTDPPAALVIRSGKTNGFIAGADVGEFKGLSDPARVEELILQGHAVIDRLEALPYPTIALINGFCLGGGLELALACDFRIAADDARIGLPEVRLGIHPGLGGTARLTRLIPASAAMGMMLTGRALRARAAKRMGVVDAVTQLRHFERAAQFAIGGKLRVKRRKVLTALLNATPLRWPLAAIMRRQVAQKARPDHYPAPYALIDLWLRYGGSRKAMLTQEAKSVAKLITGGTAQNLVRVFFLNERMKSLGKESGAPIHHVHVIGAGTMGGDIAAWCALQGMTVTLQDRAAEFIAPAIGRAAKLYKRRLRDKTKARAALDRLIPDLTGAGVAQADVVIEAVPEQLELKHTIYRDIEPKMKPDAVLATNTSSIPLEELCTALKKPSRLVGLHFFNPVAQMPLLEVVRGEKTSKAALDTGLAFAQQIDKLPLPVKSAPGFLVNRALTPYLMAAVDLLQEGNAPAAIDAAAEAFGMPMGPLELADAVGLDICLHVGEILAGDPNWQPPAKLKALVEGGNLGKKTGRGFYEYKKGKPVKPKAPGNGNDSVLQDRLMLPMLNTCVACWREGLVEDVDLLDGGMIFGTGFAPFRGGPMHYLRNSDRDVMQNKLTDFGKRFGPKYEPDEGWKTLFSG